MFTISDTDTHPPFSNHLMSTPTSKKRPLDEKDVDYVFAMPILPTPRKTKRQSPGISTWTISNVVLIIVIMFYCHYSQQNIPSYPLRVPWIAPWMTFRKPQSLLEGQYFLIFINRWNLMTFQMEFFLDWTMKIGGSIRRIVPTTEDRNRRAKSSAASSAVWIVSVTCSLLDAVNSTASAMPNHPAAVPTSFPTR